MILAPVDQDWLVELVTEPGGLIGMQHQQQGSSYDDDRKMPANHSVFPLHDQMMPRPIRGPIQLVDRLPPPDRLIVDFDDGVSISPDEEEYLLNFLKRCEQKSTLTYKGGDSFFQKKERPREASEPSTTRPSKLSRVGQDPFQDNASVQRPSRSGLEDEGKSSKPPAGQQEKDRASSPSIDDHFLGIPIGRGLTDSPTMSLSSLFEYQTGPAAAPSHPSLPPRIPSVSTEQRIPVDSHSHDARWMQKFQEWKTWMKESLRQQVQARRDNSSSLPLLTAPDLSDLEGTNPSLSNWVKRQRADKKKKEAGQRSPLTDERESLLAAHGFIWDWQAYSWDQRYLELVQYQQQHGHCRVPHKYEPNPPLGIWCKCQRRQYVLFRRGERSNMTQDRLERLSRIGFFQSE